MTIENFTWDSQNESVSWRYDGKYIEKTFKNLLFASVSQKNIVYVQVGKDYSQQQVYHFSFEGKQIFTFDMVSGKVSWLYRDQLVEFDGKNIGYAQIYSIQGVVIIITGPTPGHEKLVGLTLDGKLSFKKEPPQGYSFRYLSTSNKQPSVVCDGEADAYGRSRWHFAIDTQTGDMTKINLAY